MNATDLDRLLADRDDLREAFDADGFDVVEGTHSPSGGLGLAAVHRTARTVGGVPKRAYYLEGTPWQRGWLMAALDRAGVKRMAVDFVDAVVPAFVEHRAAAAAHENEDDDGGRRPLWGVAVARFVELLTARAVRRHPGDYPADLIEELVGLHDGYHRRPAPAGGRRGRALLDTEELGPTPESHAARAAREPRLQDLLTLNLGIDALLAVVYTGLSMREYLAVLRDEAPEGRDRHEARALIDDLDHLAAADGPRAARHLRYRVPVMCNAFALMGTPGSGQTPWFGRDFMFPTAGVFQEVACPVIHRPLGEDGAPAGRPLLCMTAPGFVGAVTALNDDGLALGVDMLPGGNCDYHRPGLNSLLLVRHAAATGGDLGSAIEAIADAQRGVSWLYVAAHGGTRRAAAIEAGMKTDNLEPGIYPPRRVWRLLKDERWFAGDRGLFVREAAWQPPQGPAKLNEALFRRFKLPYDPDAWGPDGVLVPRCWSKPQHPDPLRPYQGRALPGMFYFPPQREARADVLLATNHAIVPSARLCGMHPFTNLVGGGDAEDSQRRYDRLNARLGELLDAAPGGVLDADGAWAAATFNEFDDDEPCPGEDPPGGDEIVRGAICLCDLHARSMRCLYGHRGDATVTLTLPRYLGEVATDGPGRGSGRVTRRSPSRRTSPPTPRRGSASTSRRR